MITLSMCVNKGVGAIVILNQGVVIHKDVTRLANKDIHYTEQYLNLFAKALSQLGTLTEQRKLDYKVDCVMEMRCKQVVNWFKTLKCPKKHSEKFLDTLKVFDQLPYKYILVSESLPTALYYTKPKYINEEQYTSVYDLV